MNEQLIYDVGVDALAGVHYPDAIFKGVDEGQVLGIFLRTFKDLDTARTVIRRIISKKKYKAIVVHTAKFDNSHAYPITQLDEQVLYDAAWLQKLQEQSTTKVYISPFCEHNHPARVMGPLFEKIRRVAPDCGLVNSIWKGQEVPNTITEIHIENARTLPRIPKNDFFISFDGFGGNENDPRRVDFPDTNIWEIIKHYLKSGRLKQVRAWNFRCNGKYGAEDDAAVDKRKHFPDANYLRGLILSLSERDGEQWEDDKLYKTFSDDHGTDLTKSKDCKALFILPIGDKSITVFNNKGEAIDSINRYATPHSGKPKGNRYYSKKSMAELATRAYATAKSYRIRIKDLPTIDSRIRSGIYKDK